MISFPLYVKYEGPAIALTPLILPATAESEVISLLYITFLSLSTITLIVWSSVILSIVKV